MAHIFRLKHAGKLPMVVFELAIEPSRLLAGELQRMRVTKREERKELKCKTRRAGSHLE